MRAGALSEVCLKGPRSPAYVRTAAGSGSSDDGACTERQDVRRWRVAELMRAAQAQVHITGKVRSVGAGWAL